MEAEEIVTKINRKELRKQKLMEYLAAKGRLKPPNPKPYLRDDFKAKSTSMSTVKDDLANGKENQAMGKENQGPDALKMKKEAVKVKHLTVKAFSQITGTLHSTTNKQCFTTSSSTLRPLSAVSITTRLKAIKGAIKPSAVAPGHPAHLKIVPARPHSTVPTKTCPGTTNHPRTKPNPAVKGSNTCPNSAKPLANTGRTYSANTTRPQPNTTGKPTNTRPNTASTRPSTSSIARMSLSTAAKTKTGLMCAQVQPRNTHPRATIPAPAAAPTTSFVLNRACPSTIPVPAVTQRLVTTQRRTNPVTTMSKTNQRTGASAVDNGQRRSQALSRIDSKPLPGRISKSAGLRQPAAGPKPTIQSPTGLPGSKTAAMKPGEKGKNAARVSIQVVEPVKRAPPQHRAEARGAGGATTRTCKPDSQASTGITGNRWQAKALSRAMHAAVAKMGQKGSREENRETATDTNVPSMSINVPTPACWPNRSTVNGVWIPQTVPRSAREFSHSQVEVGWAAGVGLKTPRDQARIMPQTEGRKNMTAAQEERIKKLQEWRENRGISYKRPPMPVRPQARRTVALPQPYWAGMEDEYLEAKSLVGAVDRCLADCIKLLDEGCLSTQVQEMLSRVPLAEKFSKYWICQARLMERQGNLEVLPLFEEAVRVVLEV
ncbi:unnamed protein product [Coregonus sp. 'balchen']|nr:unnamed protein product [Coregonus sp. 'balchen']